MHVSISALVFWALLAITVFAIASKLLRLPYPAVMLLGGGALALIPGLPQVVLPPDLVFLVLLPLLLFGGGWSTDFREFKEFLTPILWLALGLVVITTVIVAYAAHAWLGLPLAAGFVLGAILSPSDAIAAEAIADEIPFDRSTGAIISGESLVNDAAALVIYAFAIEAVVSGTFSLAPAVGDFFYVTTVGVGIGLGVSALMVLVTRALRRVNLIDELISILVSMVTPFLVYLPAQAAGASGVLAAVSGGIWLSARSGGLFDAEERIALAAVWTTVTFVLNGLAFLLIGLQLRGVFAQLSAYSPWTLAAYGLGTAALVIVVRVVVAVPFAYWNFVIRRRTEGLTDKIPWASILIVSWSGVRGIVTLASALAIPATTASGAPFPGRPLILFLAFSTIVVTLLGQGLTLPFLVKRFASGDDGLAKDVDAAHAEIARAAKERLRQFEESFESTQEWEIAGRLMATLDGRIDQATSRPDGNGEPAADSTAAIERKLRRELFAAEREALERGRKDGTVGDRAYRHVQYEIDLAESQLNQVDV